MQLYILPGNPPPNYELRDVYNRGYEHYKKTWERLFNRPNRPKLYDPMGYYRQNYIFHVEDDERVVCQTLGTHYHLDNKISLDLPFFEKFYGAPLEYLNKNHVSSCLSLEYSSVAKAYSPRKLDGLNMYKVIIQLSIKYAKSLAVDAVIGHPRRLTKTNDVTTEIGCKVIKANEEKYGVTVDVSVGLLKEVTSYSELNVNRLINNLWDSRIDSIGLTTEDQEQYYSQFLETNKIKAEVA